MRKISLKNVAKFIVTSLAIALVLHDVYMLIVYPIVAKAVTALTGKGLITFVIAIVYVIDSLEYFDEHLKCVKTLRTRQHATRTY